jgi:hypothetical protein
MNKSEVDRLSVVTGDNDVVMGCIQDDVDTRSPDVPSDFVDYIYNLRYVLAAHG